MTRNHRRMHRIVWPALACAVSFALVLAFILRAPPPEPAPPPAQEQKQ